MNHISIDRSRCTSATCIRRWRCARFNDVNYGSEVILSYTDLTKQCKDSEDPFAFFVNWLGDKTMEAEDRHGK